MPNRRVDTYLSTILHVLDLVQNQLRKCKATFLLFDESICQMLNVLGRLDTILARIVYESVMDKMYNFFSKMTLIFT